MVGHYNRDRAGCEHLVDELEQLRNILRRVFVTAIEESHKCVEKHDLVLAGIEQLWPLQVELLPHAHGADEKPFIIDQLRRIVGLQEPEAANAVHDGPVSDFRREIQDLKLLRHHKVAPQLAWSVPEGLGDRQQNPTFRVAWNSADAGDPILWDELTDDER